MSTQEQHNDFLQARIKALETENERLNNELKFIKKVVSKSRVSDPNFNRPLSEIETNFEIITK